MVVRRPTTPAPIKPPPPTAELVRQCISDYDSDSGCSTPDQALGLVFQRYPENTSTEEIFVKAAVLNALYGTQVIALRKVAEHIHMGHIDPLLAVGAAEAVSTLTAVSLGGKTRRLYSFATKYCAWHRPDQYPTFDRYVEALLIAYRRSGVISSFRTEELRDYPTFRALVASLRGDFGLGTLSFKDFDKFLWLEGRRYGRLTTASSVTASAVGFLRAETNERCPGELA